MFSPILRDTFRLLRMTGSLSKHMLFARSADVVALTKQARDPMLCSMFYKVLAS